MQPQLNLAAVSGYPTAGTVLLGKYRVDSLIGAGGMGYVLKAHHMELDLPVAIKCLLPELLDREDQVQRFLREARACSKLRGAHIARVMDVGRLPDSAPIIVMEYLEGADLSAIVKTHGAQDVDMAADLMLQACEGLAEAHGAGIIHRDVKSSNFFIIQESNQPPLLKVLDFGIATAPTGKSDLTGEQTVMGTPDYMAPEQMRSTKDVDQRSDIWSLGVVLYELLEGVRPFRADSYASLCFAVGVDQPPAMRQPVPEALQQIVLRCLAKSLDQRYQSVAELAWELIPFASDPALARGSAERCSRYLSAGVPISSPGSNSGAVEARGSMAVIALAPRTPSSPPSSANVPPQQLQPPSASPTVNLTPPHRHKSPSRPSTPSAERVELPPVLDAVPQLQPSGRGMLVIGGLLLVVAAVAIVVWQTRSTPAPLPIDSTQLPTPIDARPSLAPDAAATALLHVASTPEGATVWRNNVKLGVTPLHLIVPLSIGDTAEPVRLELKGYRSETRSVLIRSETSLDLTLQVDTKKNNGGKKLGDDKGSNGRLDIIMTR